MSLLEKYNRVSIFYGSNKEHKKHIQYSHHGVDFFTPKDFHNEYIYNEYAYEHIDFEEWQYNDIWETIDNRVKISIVDYMSDLSDIIIDVYTSPDSDLMKWIMSFQTKTGNLWKINYKQNYVFKFEYDANLEMDDWIDDYFDMVGSTCNIDGYSTTSIKASPYSAKYKHYMEWIQRGREHYGINIKEDKDSNVFHFKARMNNVPCIQSVLNDLLIDYGYNWLKPSETPFKPKVKIVPTDNWQIYELSMGPHNVQYNWYKDEANIYGAWFPYIRSLTELKRKEKDDREGVEAMRRLLIKW